MKVVFNRRMHAVDMADGITAVDVEPHTFYEAYSVTEVIVDYKDDDGPFDAKIALIQIPGRAWPVAVAVNLEHGEKVEVIEQ